MDDECTISTLFSIGDIVKVYVPALRVGKNHIHHYRHDDDSCYCQFTLGKVWSMDADHTWCYAFVTGRGSIHDHHWIDVLLSNGVSAKIFVDYCASIDDRDDPTETNDFDFATRALERCPDCEKQKELHGPKRCTWYIVEE